MKHIVISLLYLGLIFGLSTLVFNPTNLYYELPWLDIPMHILGGFGVVALLLAIASYKGSKVGYKRIIVMYLLVAVCWELYELAHDLLTEGMWLGDWLDTASDIINGAIGATVAYFFLK